MFPSLTDLDLADTQIVDVALPYLIAAKRLKRLNVSNTRLSEDAMASLKRQLRWCEIVVSS